MSSKDRVRWSGRIRSGDLMVTLPAGMWRHRDGEGGYLGDRTARLLELLAARYPEGVTASDLVPSGLTAPDTADVNKPLTRLLGVLERLGLRGLVDRQDRGVYRLAVAPEPEPAEHDAVVRLDAEGILVYLAGLPPIARAYRVRGSSPVGRLLGEALRLAGVPTQIYGEGSFARLELSAQLSDGRPVALDVPLLDAGVRSEDTLRVGARFDLAFGGLRAAGELRSDDPLLAEAEAVLGWLRGEDGGVR